MRQLESTSTSTLVGVGAFTWAAAGGDEDNIGLELWIR
jgi:hypothetical protein